MAAITAPLLVLSSVHTLNSTPVGGQSAGLVLASVHDLDVTASTYHQTGGGSPVVVEYNGFLLLRSANRAVQLSGELGKGSFASFSRATRVGVFDIVDRVNPIALTSVRGGIASSFSWLFYTNESDVAKARTLFASGGALEVRVCPEPLLQGSWISILEVTESLLPYATWARKFEVQFIQTSSPS